MAVPDMEFQVQGYKIRKIFFIKINTQDENEINLDKRTCTGLYTNYFAKKI